MDFNPYSLKHQYSQLNYMVTRLKASLNYVPEDDINFAQAQELLKSLTISRAIVREFCYQNNVKLRSDK